MKEDVAKQWVEALRSGEFKQGRGRLKREAFDPDGSGAQMGYTHCCLGVLCEIIGAKETQMPGGSIAFGDGADIRVGDLPMGILREVGMGSSSGMCVEGVQLIIGPHAYHDLAHANDSGATFEEIADYIEDNWQDL